MAYQMSFGSAPPDERDVFPSGLKTGALSAPGDVVRRRGVAPAFASTRKTSVLSLVSGSAVRLLVNARLRPSGDQTGSASSKAPDVTWTSVFVPMSKTWMWSRRSPRYPSPSFLNWRRRITIGLGGFVFPGAASASSGSGSLTTRASRVPSGDHAKAETLAFTSVRRVASPPRRSRTKTCAPFPSRSARNATKRSSGLKRGLVSDLGLDVRRSGLAPGAGREPDVGVGLVLGRAQRRDLVRDPLAVGAQLRALDVAQREDVVGAERALGGGVGEDRGAERGQRSGEEQGCRGAGRSHSP